MRVSIFASGSSGNCALFSAGGTNILIDAGISARRVCAFLAGEGLTPQELDGVLVTHEHSDHVSGLPMLLKRFPLRVLAPGRAAGQLRALVPGYGEYIEEIAPGRGFALGGAYVSPFATLHDAAGSVGYRLDGKGCSFGVCTDLGCVTDEVLDTLCGVEGALIEANHDVGMLRRGPYPYHLKRRILSDHGHLCNEDCAQLAVTLAAAGAGTLILGHLSRHNNTPQAAYEAVSAALAESGQGRCELLVAPPLGPLILEEKRCSA